MDVLAWILSGLLAALFLTAGLKKATTPREELLANMPSLAGFSTPQVKAIGTLEILGAIGLVLPWLLDIAPVLSGVAALGLAALMAGA
ncbi:DoxX family protein, partial [Nocardioides sp.]|uniref:DoxX family protein n=1 Tax=Nocardioides sp. TaxID=35761 RepID=UPI003564695D